MVSFTKRNPLGQVAEVAPTNIGISRAALRELLITLSVAYSSDLQKRYGADMRSNESAISVHATYEHARLSKVLEETEKVIDALSVPAE